MSSWSAAIAGVVAEAFGVAAESLRVRGRKGNQARSVAVYLTRALPRLPIEGIGTYFGVLRASAVSHIVATPPAATEKAPPFAEGC